MDKACSSSSERNLFCPTRMSFATSGLLLPIRVGFLKVIARCAVRTLVCDSSPYLACSDESYDLDSGLLESLPATFFPVDKCKDSDNGSVRVTYGRDGA